MSEPSGTVERMVDDLRRGVSYATRAGLLSQDPATLKEACDTLELGPKAEVRALAQSITKIAKLIAPITFADLSSDRDPFSRESQKRARAMQVGLSIFALIVLALIGYFMHALRIEQGAITAVERVEQLRSDVKITELRNLAEYDQPIPRRNGLYEELQHRIADLKLLNNQLYVIYNDATEALELPLFPTYRYFFPKSLPTVTYDASKGPGKVSSGAAPAEDKQGNTAGQVAADDAISVQCAEDSTGAVRLQGAALTYPQWMQLVLAETSSDFCFQLRVLFPGEQSLLSQSVNGLSFVSGIKSKAALRAQWFLPFFYGLLGSAIFLMRNVASTRVPSIEWIALATRLSLGGVAGIVIGWFVSSASAGFDASGNLSIPFALAFLAGYAIEILFTILDRLNRAVAGSTTRD